MPRFLLLPGLLACITLLSGCGLLKKFLHSRKHPPAEADHSGNVFVGVIESVNPEQKFVLVRTDMRMVIAPGTRMETRSINGAKGALVVTPEHKMNFISADIAEGSPAAGDIVIIHSQSDVPGQPAVPSVPSLQAPPAAMPAPGPM